MNQQQTPADPTRDPEIQEVLAALVAHRGMRFDSTDTQTWALALAPHMNSNGLIRDAAARLIRNPEEWVSIAALGAHIREVRKERLARAEGSGLLPLAPSGISPQQYQVWLRVRNTLAVRGVAPAQIDSGARRAAGIPVPATIQARKPRALPRLTASVHDDGTVER